MAETLDSHSTSLGPPLPQTSVSEATNGSEDEPMPAAPNPKDESDSESESDSDSEDDEAQQSLRVQELETELSNNPSNYDAHVQYIKALRKQGDLEKLREAREAMSALFPLSPEMWQEWAKDEAALGSGFEVSLSIEKLYERGVSDYLSVPLWCDYLNFVKESDPAVRECATAGISKARNLFERALTAAGLHIAEGSRIWELYEDFEQAILLTIQDVDNESRDKQIQRIRNLFHRQLSVPHAALRSTLLRYKSWEAEQGTILDANTTDLDGLSPHAASAYKKAEEMLNARAHFEKQILQNGISDSEKLQLFMTYLKFEQSSGDPARVQILYERAVAELPISGEVWLDYTRYLDKIFKTSRIVKEVYHRATRNCPWVAEIWVRYLLCLERCHASEEELSGVFEKSLQCTFSSFDEYLEIFLTRVDSLRRRISLAGNEANVLDFALIRDTFQRASGYLSPHLKNSDSLFQMYGYWARLEANLGKDLVAARGVWESLLKISGSMLEVWQRYIAMEIEMGHINEARSLYKRCYSKRFVGTGSEDICRSWVRFEREYGSLEDFDFAQLKVTPRLEELQLFKLQQESKSLYTSTDQKENLLKQNVREKRKPTPHSADEQSPAKRRKDAAHNSKKIHGKDGEAKDSRKPTDLEGDPVKPDGASEKETKDMSYGKTRQYNDQCTAFLSNLSLEATNEDLRTFFSDVGGVVAIRILLDKFTRKSRGLAYVDFSDDEHLAAALAKNKQNLLGKRVSIARSDPQQSKKKGPVARKTTADHGHMDDQGNQGGTSSTKESSGTFKDNTGASAHHRRGNDNVELRGKNTFAVPRTVVKPLGWTSKNKTKSDESEEGGDEKPKSNDEFRKMFLKST